MSDVSDSNLEKRKFRIDRYVVPKASRDEFLVGVRKMAVFLKTLDGCVRTLAVEAPLSLETISVITIAEWDSAEAIRNAFPKVRAMHQESGNNPGANLKRLGVTAEQAEYLPITD